MVQRKAKLEEERNYELVSRQRRAEGTFCKSFFNFLFSQVGLVLLCVGIALGGAYLFVKIEEDNEALAYDKKKKWGRDVDDATEYYSTTFYWYVYGDEFQYDKEKFVEIVDRDLHDYTKFVVDGVKQVKYDGNVEGWDKSWTFQNALLFTISICTTIGFGHIAPETLTGQLFTIVYAILSIGVFVLMLANVGSGLARGIIYTYSRCCCRWFRSARLSSEIPSRTLRKKLHRRLIDEDVGEETYMATDSISIPIIVNIVLIFQYVFVGAMLFSSWEGWDFISAVYFSFVTLTTIGFGDLAPLNSFKGIDKSAGARDQMRMVITVIYCAIGLAVISVCVSLIQEQVAKKAARVLNKSEEVVEMDRVEIVPRRDNITEDPNEQMNHSSPPIMAAPIPLGSVPEDIEEDEEEDDEGSTPFDNDGGGSRPDSGKSTIPGQAEEGDGEGEGDKPTEEGEGEKPTEEEGEQPDEEGEKNEEEEEKTNEEKEDEPDEQKEDDDNQ